MSGVARTRDPADPRVGLDQLTPEPFNPAQS
jgi:hypothetical protein